MNAKGGNESEEWKKKVKVEKGKKKKKRRYCSGNGGDRESLLEKKNPVSRRKADYGFDSKCCMP